MSNIQGYGQTIDPKWRDLTQEEERAERCERIALLAIGAFVIIGTLIGFSLMCKYAPQTAQKFKQKWLIPIGGALLGGFPMIYSFFLDKEKSLHGSTKKIQQDPELAEDVIEIFRNGDLEDLITLIEGHGGVKALIELVDELDEQEEVEQVKEAIEKHKAGNKESAEEKIREVQEKLAQKKAERESPSDSQNS